MHLGQQNQNFEDAKFSTCRCRRSVSIRNSNPRWKKAPRVTVGRPLWHYESWIFLNLFVTFRYPKRWTDSCAGKKKCEGTAVKIFRVLAVQISMVTNWVVTTNPLGQNDKSRGKVPVRFRLESANNVMMITPAWFFSRDPYKPEYEVIRVHTGTGRARIALWRV